MVITEDKMDALFPISVDFVPGEQPSEEKLDGFAAQTEAGFALLEEIIGDPRDEKYTGDVSTTLNMLATPARIANISRLIGPASALNPYRPSLGSHIAIPNIANPIVLNPDNIPVGVHKFNLRTDCGIDLPFTYTAGDDISNEALVFDKTPVTSARQAIADALIDIAGDSVFANWVTSLALVNSTGDFFIDELGNVYTYDVTGNYASDTLEIDYSVYPDNYVEASVNVIAGEIESPAVAGIVDGGTYARITLTSGINSYGLLNQNNIILRSTDDGCTDTNLGGLLPYCLVSNNIVTEIPTVSYSLIPEGLIQIFDDNGTLVTDINIYWESNTQLLVSPDTALNDGTSCTVATVGSSITETLANLKRRFELHNHTASGDSTGQATTGYTKPIKHINLVNNDISSADVSTKWSKTVNTLVQAPITGDDHPQYLCRYGWKDTLGTSSICDNAFLGDLFIAANLGASAYTQESDTYESNILDSHKIYFGHSANYIYSDDQSGSSLLTMRGTYINITSATETYIQADSGGSILERINGIEKITITGSTTTISNTDITVSASDQLTLSTTIVGDINLESADNIGLEAVDNINLTADEDINLLAVEIYTLQTGTGIVTDVMIATPTETTLSNTTLTLTPDTLTIRPAAYFNIHRNARIYPTDDNFGTVVVDSRELQFSNTLNKIYYSAANGLTMDGAAIQLTANSQSVFSSDGSGLAISALASAAIKVGSPTPTNVFSSSLSTTYLYASTTCNLYVGGTTVFGSSGTTTTIRGTTTINLTTSGSIVLTCDTDPTDYIKFNGHTFLTTEIAHDTTTAESSHKLYLGNTANYIYYEYNTGLSILNIRSNGSIYVAGTLFNMRDMTKGFGLPYFGTTAAILALTGISYGNMVWNEETQHIMIYTDSGWKTVTHS